MIRRATFTLKIIILSFWVLFISAVFLALSPLYWRSWNLNQSYGQVLSRGMRLILGWQAQVAGGLEHLDTHQPCVYLVNHQNIWEVAIFAVLYPKKTVIIGRREVAWIPLFGLLFMAAGNLLIRRNQRTQAVLSLKAAVAQIKKHQLSLWVFPEGTRNRSLEPLLPLKRGPFHLALQAQIPLVPVVAGSFRALYQADQYLLQKGTVRLKVLSPLFPPPVSDLTPLSQEATDAWINAAILNASTRMAKAIQELSSTA